MEAKQIFQNPIQIGIIVRDLEALLADFRDILGMDGFRIAEFPPDGAGTPIREYHGRQGEFVGRFCFYDWGNIELELIQPVSGDSVWEDYLKTAPNGVGIHHIKFMVDHHGPTDQYFAEKGISCVTAGEGVGPNSGRIWKFFDTFGKLGFDVEILNKVTGEEGKPS